MAGIRFVRLALSLLVSAMLVGCPSDDDDSQSSTDNNSQGQVARVVVTPSSAFLTQKGQTKSLSAKAYDATGKVVAADISWTSTHTDQLNIDLVGNLSTLVENGSAQIVAEAGGIRSAPIVAVATTLRRTTVPSNRPYATYRKPTVEK